MSHVKHNSGKDAWFTPPPIIEAARKTMGSIDLDPASCAKANEIVKAQRYYTKENSGLDQCWFGNVWLNPPYTRGVVGDFVNKLIKGWDNDEFSQAIILTNNATETFWGQELLSNCDAVCFPKKRIKFLDENLEPANSPIQGQMITYFGNFSEDFYNNFQQFGRILC